MKRRLIGITLCILLTLGLFPGSALAAPEWPSDISIDSDAGIIMDAHSGAVIYGKNIHSTFSPASITKVLTALIILENCSLDDIVTFSQNAVYNVESNSSSAGYDTGDQATVKDCLYALLLKSANESGNALAEHLSGTTEDFAKLMNEKAAELGCQDSNFTNPSGLNDENHYVSAYDMALITKAAFDNPIFSEIVATTYYTLPPNKTNPNGQGISPGNKMIKPRSPAQYRPDVIGGKTGYTSIALNTLVICSEQDDMKFVTVILHSQSTQYEDTKKLLDFGYRNFRTVKIADYDQTYSSIGDDLMISGLPTSDKPVLTIDPNSCVTLPKNADFSEAVATLDYTLPSEAPAGSIARVNYTMQDRLIGHAYLTLSDTQTSGTTTLPEALLTVQPSSIAPAGTISSDDPEHTSTVEGDTDAPNNKNPDSKLKISFKIPAIALKILLGIVLVAAAAGGIVVFISNKQKKEMEELQMRRMRRMERLKESGMSEAEFNLLMEKRKSEPRKTEKKPKRRR